MAKLVIQNGEAVYVPGSGVDFGGAGPVQTATTLTGSQAITFPGMYILSATQGIGGATQTGVKVTLPLASTVPLGMFGFRNTSSPAVHVITSSEAGSQPFGIITLPSGSNAITAGTGRGSFVTMSAFIGSSIMMISDGNAYNIFASTGTMTFGFGT